MKPDIDYTYHSHYRCAGPFDNLKLKDGGEAVVVAGTANTRTYRMPNGMTVKVRKGMSPEDYEYLGLIPSKQSIY